MVTYELKKTLDENQKELACLVKKYDQAVKDLEYREEESIWQLKPLCYGLLV